MNLSDAKELLARAERRYAEFEDMVGPRKSWSIDKKQDTSTGSWHYAIQIKPAIFEETRFVISEAASLLSSSLDHLASAIAQAHGVARPRGYFPVGYTDSEFEKKLERASEELGDEMCGILREARDKQRVNLPHLQAAKQLANDGKHWKLRPVVMNGAGISPIGADFESEYFNLPADAFKNADRYEFHHGEKLNDARGYRLLLGFTVDGLDDGVPDSIWAIFNCAFRFAQGMIDAVEKKPA